MSATVHVSIGNSDDKLSQYEWSQYHFEVDQWIRSFASVVHGVFLSESSSRWQNACWAFEIYDDRVRDLQMHLRNLATRFGQESIAWTSGTTQFIKGDIDGQ